MNRVRDVAHLIRNFSKWHVAGLATVFALHLVCFYWWVSDAYYFSGDGLFYFSRRITSFAELWSRLISLDDLYQYRPLSYVVFSYVLYPLFGANPAPYHVAAYFLSLINILLVCGCCYFWLCRDRKRTLIASVFLLLNPVNFFPSYGLSYLDVLLSLFFYFLALILIVADTKRAWLLAPLFAALALLSREHSIVLPAQALLILLATGVSLRAALSRTRNVWLVAFAYVAFQLVIRQGAVFAPGTANSNIQFNFSLERVELLIKGAKSAMYFPESIYQDEVLRDYRGLAHLGFVIPWLGIILWVLFRRDRVALSGIIWLPMALLPIAFIHNPPFPRHYYLALPGLAVLFASAVRNRRVMVYVSSIFALVTLTNVAIYAQTSWIAEGSRLTKKYVQEIQSMAERSGRRDFYVLNEGDPYFYWHIDGGLPPHLFLEKKLSFRFAVGSHELRMESLLANSVNIVIPTFEGIHDAVETGRFPKFGDNPLCGPIRRVTGSEGDCAVFFRGTPLENTDLPVVETPNGMPIIDLADQIVTLSRTTIFLKGSSGINFNATVTAAPESTDGVNLEIYKVAAAKFDRIFQAHIGPGEQIHLEKSFDGSDGSSRAPMFVLRIGPGPNGDETRDWLFWRISRQ